MKMKNINKIWVYLFSPFVNTRLRAKLKMPYKVIHYRYCHEWFNYRGDERRMGRPWTTHKKPFIPLPPYKNQFMFCPSQIGINYSDSKYYPQLSWHLKSSNNELPLVGSILIDGYVGLYKVVNRQRNNRFKIPISSKDDEYEATLQLVDIIPESMYQTILIKTNTAENQK